MNNTNFNQTGGFPLKTERLQELQTAYSIFNSLGALAGNLTIISGCALTGTTVGNGFVYIDGELLEFREADSTGTPEVIIIEEVVNRAFKNGVIKQVHAIRYATFGTADTSWLWSEFKRINPLIAMMARLEVLEKKSAVFQAGGGMVLWNKTAADIPAGWQEVVDWRGRMPVGFDASQEEFNTMGKMEGATDKTLSIQELPKFTPTGTAAGPYSGTDIIGGGGFDGGGNGWKERPIKMNEIGGGQKFSILNPYRVVLFIEYIG